MAIYESSRCLACKCKLPFSVCVCVAHEFTCTNDSPFNDQSAQFEAVNELPESRRLFSYVVVVASIVTVVVVDVVVVA